MDLEIRGTPDKGVGVFTTRPFSLLEVVLRFEGPRLKRSQLPLFIPDEEDHYLQVGPDDYLGPSGKVDDFVNHSCLPNCGVVIVEDGMPLLVALRPLRSGEELTFDYSTTSTDIDTWSLTCLCGTPVCRQVVSGFTLLPRQIQARYIEMGIVPKYVIDHVEPVLGVEPRCL